ncbi:non-specific lipid transfer protein GPI-anchored 13 [Oryza brachyantha]|uniref:non-specific lipid transfer protein GPI-anchored 13 n=1 Tax=Oryza brachyantha TaxID=4533 RepID=UPI001ADBA6AE|nr:non-specific lipid transfer protein GPI-anchored 13 [Oryza brachyantha]
MAARWVLWVAVVAAAAMAGAAAGDFAADRAECADKLMGLATCLTFVEEKATARAPTRDCCAGLGQVVAGSKKCLCVLVKDRDEPALGFRINVTRAMDLPSLCSIPATFSDCPKLLNISSDSKEAEIFKQYAREHESSDGTKAAPAAAAAATGSAGTAASTGGAGDGQRRRSSLAVAAAVLAAAVFGLAVA